MIDSELESAALDQVRRILAGLKRYTLIKMLGIGGMGCVVLARHEVLGSLRAIKIISPEWLKESTILQRFFAEARIMEKLQSPHIARVFDVDEASGHPYIIMEYLSGGSLFDHLKEFGPMPPKQAVEVALAILSALEAAHANTTEDGQPASVIHRDVKAENILFTSLGVPKLVDFGIARIEEKARGLTLDSTTLGTFAYMAPEQRDARTVDPRADLYAVGVTLFVMLKAPSQMWVDPFHTFIERNPDAMNGIPPEIEMVIRISTCERREDRYASASKMAEELRAHVASLPEDPLETPSLGSAPAHTEERTSVEHLPSAAIEPIGNALIVGPTRAMPGSQAAVEGMASQVSCVPDLVDTPPRLIAPARAKRLRAKAPLPLGTLHEGNMSDTVFRREVEIASSEAKRRFFVTIFMIVTLAVLGGVFLWLVIRSATDGGSDRTVGSGSAEETFSVFVPYSDEIPPQQAESATDTLDPVSTGDLAPEQIEPTPTPRRDVGRASSKDTHEVSATPTVDPLTMEITPEVVTSTLGADDVVATATVSLVLVGNTIASASLRGESGEYRLSSETRFVDLPAGTYGVSVEMDGRENPQRGTITIVEGMTTTITCDTRFMKCTGLK